MFPKVKLFESNKEFFLSALILILIILVRLSFDYANYKRFISKPFYYTNATVLNQYQKGNNGRKYTVLKLRSDDGFSFFTTDKVSRNGLVGSRVRVEIFPNDSIRYWDYLKYFYVKSHIKQVYLVRSSFKNKLFKYVSSQHNDNELKSFYKAIFFASPLQQTLRKKISELGVSHLVALSGFHLGILWALLYGALLLLHKPLQKYYFPYRYSLIDLGTIIIFILGIYIWFVGYPPSLLRSYAMLFIGWLIVIFGIELFSFTFLFIVILLLLVFLPSLIASLSFGLSVAGVFYIFLILHYFPNANKWIISLFLIPVGIFVLMQPIVHSIFGMTTPYQILSPLLSVLFIPFYPLVILLHLLGVGALLDSALLGLFRLPHGSSASLLPLWAAAGYLLLSLWAVWSRKIFYLLLGTALCYTAYLFY